MFGKIFKKKILIIGGNGNLGKAIRNNAFFKNSHFPTKNELDILNKKKLDNYFVDKNFHIIIHCAALARMAKCELNKKKHIP